MKSGAAYSSTSLEFGPITQIQNRVCMYVQRL